MKYSLNNISKEERTVIFIGTGPISLLKAYSLAKQNQKIKIILIDEQDRIGGAWYSDRSPLGNEIESGCHIWSFCPNAYNYIQQNIGVRLKKLKPKPLFVKKSFTIPYSTKKTFDTYKTLFSFLIKFKWNKIKLLWIEPQFSFRLFKNRNSYPIHGSVDFLNRLISKVESCDQISILLNTSVSEISLNEEIMVKTTNKSFSCQEIYLTYVSNLTKINIGKIKIPVESREVCYAHFLIQLNKPLSKKLTYWRLVDDKIVHRITDISYQTNNKELLILVGIKEAAYKNQKTEIIFDHIKLLFKKYKLINSDHELILIKTYEYPTFYLQDEVLKKLQNLDSRIKILRTTDLMFGVEYLLRNKELT